MVLAVISLVLTIFFGVFDFQRIELTAKEPAEALYLENSDYRVKGLPTPVAGDLELDSSGTLDLLLLYLKTRLSQDREDQQSADDFFRKMRQREAHNTSPQTLSHLLTMHAETLLLRGEHEEAAGLLEEARELWRDNPWATVFLYRAYKTLLDREMTGPWSDDEQSEVRRLYKKIEELEGELVRLGITRLAALSAAGDSGIALPELLHFATHSSVAFEVSERERAHRLLDLLNGAATGKGVTMAFMDQHDGDRLFTQRLPVHVVVHGLVSSSAYSVAFPTYQPFLVERVNVADDPGPPVPEVRARVVAIGIDAAGPIAGRAPLSYAAADARTTALAFKTLGFNADVLVNNNATRDTILWRLADEVLASQPGDELIVYYSGHGFTDANGNNVIVTGDGLVRGGGPSDDEVDPGPKGDVDTDNDGKRNAFFGGLLYLRELEAVLSHHRGKVTVIVDACLDERDINIQAPPVLGPWGDNRPTFLLAGGPGRIAIESNRLGGGVFTYALDVYLQSLADADPATPRFDVNAAFDFTSTETERLAMTLHGVEQRPELLVEVDRP